MRTFLTAIAAYAVLTLALGTVWNLVLFKDLYAGLTGVTTRPEPIVQLGMIAILLEAAAIAFAFQRYYDPNIGLRNALTISLGLGVFSMTYASLVVPAKFAVETVLTYTLMEVIFGIIHFTLAGIVLARVFAKNTREKA